MLQAKRRSTLEPNEKIKKNKQTEMLIELEKCLRNSYLIKKYHMMTDCTFVNLSKKTIPPFWTSFSSSRKIKVLFSCRWNWGNLCRVWEILRKRTIRSISSMNVTKQTSHREYTHRIRSQLHIKIHWNVVLRRRSRRKKWSTSIYLSSRRKSIILRLKDHLVTAKKNKVITIKLIKIKMGLERRRRFLLLK